MEMNKILDTLSSSLRITQISATNSPQNNHINTGELISFGICPWFNQNAGLVEQGKVDLNGMSHIDGTVPVIQGIPLSIDVEWSIVDDKGVPAQINVDYLAPNGLKGINISLIFIPTCFIELSSHPKMMKDNSPKKYHLKAYVKISAGEGKENSIQRELDFIELPVLPMALPIIFTAFRNRDFVQTETLDETLPGERDGMALIMVPLYSPIRSKEGLLETVSELRSRVANLSSLPDFFLLGLGLNILHNALIGEPNTILRIGSTFDLTSIKCKGEVWAKKTNSFILVGIPGCSVNCFNDKQDPTEGTFSLTIDPKSGTCYTLARNLDNKKPETEPYNNELNVDNAPTDNEGFSDRIKYIKFNDTLSSPVCFKINTSSSL